MGEKHGVKKKFRWLYIGSGRIANITADEITASGRHQVVKVYSRNKESSSKLAKRMGGTVVNGLNGHSLKNIDGAYIATPQGTHFEFAIKCIEYGIPVFIEKPFTVNSMEGKKIFEYAEKKGVLASEAMCMLYNPLLGIIKKESEKIGDIRRVRIDYAMAMMYLLRMPRLMSNKDAGGALLEIGVYGISFCSYLFDRMPDHISISTKMKDAVDISEIIVLQYGQTECILYVSLQVFRGFPRAEIYGDKGRIIVPKFSSPEKIYIYKKRERNIYKNPRGKYIFEFDAFAEAALGRKERIMQKREYTLNTMKTMDLCREQAGLIFPNDIICKI